MKMTVYADVLFAVNFVVNMILISLTALLTKKPASMVRKIVSASVGAIYAVFMFVPELRFTGLLVSKFALSAVMTAVAFGIRNIKSYIKHLCLFYMVTLMCGGCTLAFAFFSAGEQSSVAVNNGIVHFDTSLGTIALCSAICYGVIRIFFAMYKRYVSRDYRRVVVCKNGRAVTLNVLLDTGNLLTDPLTGHPVIVAEKSALKGIIPSDVDESDIVALSQHISGVRLIPFKSLGCENGLLTGFEPDSVFSDCPVNSHITIAINPASLGSGEYNALAGPESFEK